MTFRAGNLRRPAPPIGFGSRADAEAYDDECDRMERDARNKGYKFVVAPMLRVQAPTDGKWLEAGEEVTLEHFHGCHSPQRQLREHVNAGRVLEIT